MRLADWLLLGHVVEEAIRSREGVEVVVALFQQGPLLVGRDELEQLFHHIHRQFFLAVHAQ